jgi:hypothetical protein
MEKHTLNGRITCRLGAVLFATAWLGLVARTCDAATPIDPTADDANVCVLLTKSEAAAALGVPVKDGELGPLSTRGGAQCNYEPEHPEAVSPVHVAVKIMPPTIDWEKYKQDRRKELESSRPTPGKLRTVPALGDEAYFAGHVLNVRRGKVFLQVVLWKTAAAALAKGDQETPEDKLEKEIAARALTRMR